MSDDTTNKLYDDLDFGIYEEGKKINCIEDGCIAVKRLIIALVYYSRLAAANSASGADVFIAFIRELYPFALDDYHHFIVKHDSNLHSITEAVKEKQLLAVCNVRKCRFTTRHQSRESLSNKTSRSKDAIFNFYSRLMDAFHFYILHLFDCGLRTTTAANDNDEKRAIRASLARLKGSNTKFNICVSAATETVFIDELIKFLLSSKIKESTIRKVGEFFNLQAYDSDATKRDMQHEEKCNVSRGVNDKEAIKAIAEFVKATKIRTSSFNVGLCFYYWPHYKDMDEFDKNKSYNMNDHSGHKVSDLFVKQQYSSFKEEIRNYAARFMNMDAYQETMIKVKQYMESDAVKQMKAVIPDI